MVVLSTPTINTDVSGSVGLSFNALVILHCPGYPSIAAHKRFFIVYLLIFTSKNSLREYKG